MLSLSIVVPSVGPAALLEQTLLAVLENRPDECEIVVADTTGYTDPYHLAADGEIRLVPVPRGARLLDALNYGWQQSQGEVVHTLGCGATVTRGWTEAALDRLVDEPQVAAVAGLLVSMSGSVLAAGMQVTPGGRLVWRGAGSRRVERYQQADRDWGPLWTGGFYRREALATRSPFDRRFGPWAADAALNWQLVQAGWELGYEPASHITLSSPRWTSGAAFSAGCGLERLFWARRRHAEAESGCDWPSLLAHPLQVAGGALWQGHPGRAAARLAGHLCGWTASLWTRMTNAAAPAELAELAECHDVAEPALATEGWTGGELRRRAA